MPLLSEIALCFGKNRSMSELERFKSWKIGTARCILKDGSQNKYDRKPNHWAVLTVPERGKDEFKRHH